MPPIRRDVVRTLVFEICFKETTAIDDSDLDVQKKTLQIFLSA